MTSKPLEPDKPTTSRQHSNDGCETAHNPGRVGPFAEIVNHLPDGADKLRTRGFAILRRGKPATTDDLAATTGLDRDHVHLILAALVSRGAAELDQNGSLVAIGGLSLVPTRHELVLDDIELHTWCAVDALGIPAALGSDATARSHCEHCGQPLVVIFTGGNPDQSLPIVTWYPLSDGSNMRRNFCDAANAFCSPEHLAAWRAAHPHTLGEALTLDQVTARGKAIWGTERHCC